MGQYGQPPLATAGLLVFFDTTKVKNEPIFMFWYIQTFQSNLKVI